MTEDRELDDMIKVLCEEKGWRSYGIWPDLVSDDRPAPAFSSSTTPAMREKALEYRRKAIAWLAEHSEWVEAWRAEQRLNDRIEALCVEKDLQFMPWEFPRPYHSLGPPEPDGDEYTRKARRLREELIAEIEDEAS